MKWRIEKWLIGIVSAAFVVLLFSCTTTHVTSSWTAKEAKPRAYKNVLVVGIIADTNRQLRQNMETAMVQQLKGKGINATSAFDEYGPKTFTKADEQNVQGKIKAKGYDGIITISLMNKKKDKYYVPGTEYTPTGYDSPFWGYYWTRYDVVYQPGYYDTDTEYFWESNLYDLTKGNKMVYSAQSQSFNPASYESLGRQYGKLILNDIIKNGLIAGK